MPDTALRFCRLGEHSGFERFHFVETANVAHLIGKFRAQKRFHEIFGELFADDAATEHQDIHVVVLDALMRGIGVVADGGANAVNFIGGHADANTAAAHEHATVGLAIGDGVTDEFGEVGVVGGVFVERANVENVMAKRAHDVAHFTFEGEAGVVGTDDDSHASPYFFLLAAMTSLAALMMASGSKPNFFCSSLRGAEAPKVFMPMMRPPRPTYLCQPMVPACSTETRAVTDGGKTLSRYSLG